MFIKQKRDALTRATLSFRHLTTATLAAAGLALAPLAIAGELVVNGSFEEPVVPDNYPLGSRWATYFGENGAALAGDYCSTHAMNSHCADGETVPGWSAIWADTVGITDEPGRIEIQFGDIGLVSAKDGNQKAELDSHHHYDDQPLGNNDIYLYQTLKTCPRKPYVLDYWWKPRLALTADMDVYLDGRLVCEHHTTNQGPLPMWERTTFHFIADTMFTELGFTACTTGDTYGPYLDWVSVKGPTHGDPECDDPDPICGERPEYLTMLYDGDLDGVDHHRQAPGHVIVNTLTSDPLPDTVVVMAYDWRGKYKNASRGKKSQNVTPLFDREVNRGMETFTVDPASGQKWLPPVMFFEIWSVGDATTESELLQTVQFHTSCSQPLNVGDEFGGIALWAGGRN
jgi:hypothetical protein